MWQGCTLWCVAQAADANSLVPCVRAHTHTHKSHTHKSHTHKSHTHTHKSHTHAKTHIFHPCTNTWISSVFTGTQALVLLYFKCLPHALTCHWPLHVRSSTGLLLPTCSHVLPLFLTSCNDMLSACVYVFCH